MAEPAGPAVDLALRPSRMLATLVFLAHALALGGAAMAHLPPVLLAAAGATVLTSAIVQLRRHALLLGRHAVRRIVLTVDGRWQVTDGEGAVHDCELLPEPTAGPPLTLVRFRDRQGRTMTALLLGDSADPEQLRRLRARLRLG